jgi:hypothetical protein
MGLIALSGRPRPCKETTDARLREVLVGIPDARTARRTADVLGTAQAWRGLGPSRLRTATPDNTRS